MITKWLQSIWHRNHLPVAENSNLSRPEKGDEVLYDVVYEALREDMALRREALEDLQRVGWPLVKRMRFRKKIREKVKKTIAPELSEVAVSDDFVMVDEITERLVDAAENDPFFRRLFRFGSDKD